MTLIGILQVAHIFLFCDVRLLFLVFDFHRFICLFVTVVPMCIFQPSGCHISNKLPLLVISTLSLLNSSRPTSDYNVVHIHLGLHYQQHYFASIRHSMMAFWRNHFTRYIVQRHCGVVGSLDQQSYTGSFLHCESKKRETLYSCPYLC